MRCGVLYFWAFSLLAANAEKRILMNNDGVHYDTIQRIEAEFASMKKTIVEMNNTINSMKGTKDTEQKIAFMASMTNSSVNPPTNHMLVLDQVITNSGNGYNPYTGSFVAPINGIYFFSVGFEVFGKNGEHTLHVDMRKNGINIGFLFFDTNSDYWMKRSETVTIHLNKGDSVYLIVSMVYGYSVIAPNSNFSGFLVYADQR